MFLGGFHPPPPKSAMREKGRSLNADRVDQIVHEGHSTPTCAHVDERMIRFNIQE